jgi:extracellular factor (EF) 3-hydroxypalmitic acid methyl ester biosynthesis protein
MCTSQLKQLDETIGMTQTHDGRWVMAFLQQFKQLVDELEISYPRDEIIGLIPNIRQLAAKSPFVNNAQQWPRGYQGDFESIAHLISGQNKAVPGTTGYAVEHFFLTSDICRQHIYKVQQQSALIAGILAKNTAAKIMSIGCGTSEDIRLNIDKIKTSSAEFTIVDADKDALACSMQNLDAIKNQVSTIHGNIYKIARTLTQGYDLILIGGVFDYLNDNAIVRVLSSLKQNLNNGGTLFFTNIKTHNPYRVYMEYLSNWMLIERTEEDIHRLVAESGLQSHKIKLHLDDTGLTYMVNVTCEAT